MAFDWQTLIGPLLIAAGGVAFSMWRNQILTEHKLNDFREELNRTELATDKKETDLQSEIRTAVAELRGLVTDVKVFIAKQDGVNTMMVKTLDAVTRQAEETARIVSQQRVEITQQGATISALRELYIQEKH
jgi:hypothetical protein